MAKAKKTKPEATPAGKVSRSKASAKTAGKRAAASATGKAPRRAASKTAPAVKRAKPSAAKAARTAAPAIAAQPIIDIAMKGPDMATTTTETLKKNGDAATDRVQALFGDVNGTATTALEKSSRLYEEIAELAKGNVEALLASSRLAAKGAEALGQEAAEYSKASFERASATFRSFATVKSPTELLKLQSDFARTAFDDLVAESSRMSESLLKLANEIAQPLSSRVALAAEKVKSVTAF